MSRSFLAIGECMVELAPQPSGLYAQSFAGDTFNTAWYLRRCAPDDIAVKYLSAIGDDPLSDRMQAFMQDAGIVPELARIGDRTVGLYMIALTDGERSFSYWRETSAARCLARNMAPIRALQAGDMAYFSGITLAILDDADRRTLLEALATARAAGVIIAFDPNLRPRLWDTRAEMCERVMEAARIADIALPSFEDEAQAFGDADPDATLGRYRAAGAQRVAVKDGPNAILLCDADGARTTVHPAPHPAPVDTTAAGDAFNAALLAELLQGKTLRAGAEAGCALSHIVVSHQGALVTARR